MSESDIIDSLKAIGEYNEDKNEDISCLRQKLIRIERTRQFKTWLGMICPQFQTTVIWCSWCHCYMIFLFTTQMKNLRSRPSKK
jgi:hypothetical protein